jgi:hypothetical protein
VSLASRLAHFYTDVTSVGKKSAYCADLSLLQSYLCILPMKFGREHVVEQTGLIIEPLNSFAQQARLLVE